jgi:hypothetical protein
MLYRLSHTSSFSIDLAVGGGGTSKEMLFNVTAVFCYKPFLPLNKSWIYFYLILLI